MEIFGRFWNIIIGFLLIFICPIYLVGMRMEIITDIAIINTSDLFIDKIKYSGYIERSDLSKFYMEISKLDEGRKVNIIHKRRAIRPIYNGTQITDTREFYIEVLGSEIKNKLKYDSKYKLKIGDEITLVIEKGRDVLSFLSKNIELGGMIENEYVES